MRNIILGISVLVFLSACRKEKFTSESNWLTPVLETRLDLGDLIPDSLTFVDTDNSLSLVYDGQFGVADLNEVLQIPDRVETMEVTLSSLVLEDRSFTDTLTLLELYPQSILFHNQSTTLDAQDIVANEGTVIDVSEEFFSSATFVEGWIDLTISNDLPVSAELMEFELLNYDDQNVVISGVFYNLEPDSTQSQSFDLAGKTVNGKLELRVKRVKTMASNGDVDIDVTKGLRTTFTVRGLKPQVATAVFPSQNLVERFEETKYDFGGAELTEIVIKEGYILMKVESSIEESIILEYNIPNSRESTTNKSVSRTWKIPAANPGETVYLEERFPIDGYQINLFGKTPNSLPTFNHIYNELIAKIEYSGVERTLSLDDKIKIEFGLVNLKPKLVIGDPGLHVIEVKDTLELSTFKNLNGRLNLEDASLSMDFYNTFGIETSITIDKILGVNSRSNTNILLQSNDNLSKPVFLERAINGIDFILYKTGLLLNKSNSNLKQFLENLPDRVEPEIKATIRPNGTLNQSDFAFDTSQVRVNLKINVPLQIGVKEFVISSTDSISLFQNEITEQVKAANLKLLVENDFPISGIVNLEFLTEDGTVIASGFDSTDNVMSAAEVDEVSGKSVLPSESEINIKLFREEMAQIQNASQVRINVQFDTKDARRYKMFTDYGVSVKIVADIIYENRL
ncbi:hypothetical protein N8368_03185 [Bacteroidia bacterium]|nr:hypothetical protein [Bacteroidia bacterium]MDB4106929.1 hypothetical protein [Bacteroidia bacterium]MDB9882654.1 hypothetical protein [Bacteroidia bacterium]MDC1395493.1 hypothetical protein [Bacteroidia bacterium]